MRKFRLMPFVLVASVFGLSACTLPKWLSFLSFIPGLEAPKEEKEEKKEEEEEEEEKQTVYTLESVAEDILGEPIDMDEDSEGYNCDPYDEDGGYSLFRGYLLQVDTYTEEQILPYTAEEEVPDYLEVEEDWGVQAWMSGGANGYFIDYKTPDESVYVCVYGYFVEDYEHPTYGTVDVFGVGIDVITPAQYAAQFEE